MPRHLPSPKMDIASSCNMPTTADSSNTFEAPASQTSSGRALAGSCICVLDDDASMLKALDRLLKSAGFRVKKFNNPTAFLSAVERDGCGAAILDVWMPEMNGLEVQAVLRKESPDTRIIFITGRDEPSARQAALDAGAFGFLSKPFDDEVLLDLVQKAISP
jgi:FixJ family two-component response regulator